MAVLKVLTLDGLQEYTQKLDAKLDTRFAAKVTAVEGKSLVDDSEIAKLGTVAEGAQVNVIEGVQVNGSDVEVVGKKVNIDLSGYATKGDVSAIPKYATQIVASLPTADISETTIYLVPVEGAEGNDAHDEYIYKNGKWELIGNTRIDLSDYYTKGQVDERIAAIEGDVSAVYTKTEIDGMVQTINGDIDAVEADVALKANAADVYTKAQSDAAMGLKANAADVYTQSQVDAAIDADVKVVNDRVTTEVGTINEAMALKANDADLAAVAKSGSYNDLSDLPTIPEDDVAITTAEIDSVIALLG